LIVAAALGCLGLWIAATVARRAVSRLPESGAAGAARQDALPEPSPLSFPEPAFLPGAAPEELKIEARRVAGRLAGDFPREPLALDMRARTESAFGNSAEAVKLWEACLALDPVFAPACHGIGYVAKERGDFETAVVMLRKAAALAPANRGYSTDLVDAFMGADRMREAVAELKRFMASGPVREAAAMQLGQACLALDEPENARRAFTAAVQAAPQDSQAHFGLGNAYARLGQSAKARAEMEQFRKLSAEGRTAAGERVRNSGNPALVRDIAVRAHVEAADFYQAHGNPERAEELWRRAAALDPHNVECRVRLADLYERGGRDGEALRFCEQLKQIQPGCGDHWLNVGLLSARLGRTAAGLAAVEKAVQLDPQNRKYREAYDAIRRAR
jgi:tetratricopeptide (TPR) repeat protein